MQQELKKLETNKIALHGTPVQKAQLYNAANRTVAILCNHKRSVGAAHETQMQKLADKVCSPGALAARSQANPCHS